MATSPDKIADLRVKELEMIQTVITRLAGNGATLKNYCITLAAGICGVAFSTGRPLAGLLALLPIAVCALLDAQYLRNERRFRSLFHQRRQEDWSTQPSFNIGLAAAPNECFCEALFSWSIVLFYAPLAVAVATAVTLTRVIQ